MSDIDALPRNVVGEWVRTRQAGNPVAKLVLQLVFEHAGPQEDGRWVAWASLRKLTWEANLTLGPSGMRTVRRHLEALENAKIIKREERERDNGSRTSNRIVLLVNPDDIPPRDAWKEGSGARATRTPQSGAPDSTVRGARTPESGVPRTPQSEAPGLHSPDQKPLSDAPPEAPSPSENETRAPAQQALAVPEAPVAACPDVPPEMEPIVKAVGLALMRVAAVKQAIEVKRPPVVAMLLKRQKKPHLQAIEAFEHYWLYGAGANKRMKDVVASYRTWVDREPDIQQPLPADPYGTVRTTRGSGGSSNADRVAANIRAGQEAARRLREEAPNGDRPGC